MEQVADGVDLVEAARMMRAAVAALPATSPTDRALARRIEGAALALETVAGGCPKTIVSAS